MINAIIEVINPFTFVFFLQATPRLSEDKVKQCIDPKLNNDFPPKAVAKVRYFVFLLL